MRKIVLISSFTAIAGVLAGGFNNCGGLKSASTEASSVVTPAGCPTIQDSWSETRFTSIPGAVTSYTTEPLINGSEVYVAASSSDAGNANSAITFRRSLDSGTTWTPVVVVPPSPGYSYASHLAQFGSAFYLSATVVAGGTRHWMVYRSTDKGATWKAVDDFQGGTAEQKAYAFGMVADSLGAVYVAGSATMNGHDTWIVRKSSTGDLGSWSTTDTFAPGGAIDARAAQLETGSDGSLYAIGYEHDMNFKSIIRKSSDHGATWTTIDTYQMDAAHDTYGYSLYSLDGAILMGGSGQDASGAGHWFVRRSVDKGATWSLADDHSGLPSGFVGPQSLHADQAGRIFAAGLVGSIRRSSDGGTTWSNSALPVTTMQTSAVTVDSMGNTWFSGWDGADGMLMIHKIDYPANLSKACWLQSAP